MSQTFEFHFEENTLTNSNNNNINNRSSIPVEHFEALD
jgi:hypothetical protein